MRDAHLTFASAAIIHVEVRLREPVPGAPGNACAVARHAALRGSHLFRRPRAGGDLAYIDLSGPVALFQGTLLYGRFGAVVPRALVRYRRRVDVAKVLEIIG